MKLTLLAVGYTDSPALKGLTAEYGKRLQRFADFCLEELPDVKNARNLSEAEQKTREGRELLARIRPEDVVVLLDERGSSFTSTGFADYLQKQMNAGVRRLVFVVGGPYGFSDEVYRRAKGKVSLSPMTFSHQLVRLVFTEQLYRACSILNHLPYHHP